MVEERKGKTHSLKQAIKVCKVQQLSKMKDLNTILKSQSQIKYMSKPLGPWLGHQAH
jgi:hypothetical protein